VSTVLASAVVTHVVDDAAWRAALTGMTIGDTIFQIDEGKLYIADSATTSTVDTLTATSVWLWNVDNTSDADKPVSTATQTALNAKENASNKSTNMTTDSGSNTKYPTVDAVETYVAANAWGGSMVFATENWTATIGNWYSFTVTHTLWAVPTNIECVWANTSWAIISHWWYDNWNYWFITKDRDVSDNFAFTNWMWWGSVSWSNFLRFTVSNLTTTTFDVNVIWSWSYSPDWWMIFKIS